MEKNSNLPGAKERRRLLATGSPDLGQMGLAYLGAGRWGEALECLEASQDKEGLEKLAAEALKAGDLFVCRHSSKILGRSLNTNEIRQIQQQAESLGKDSFARAAQVLLNPPEDRQ